MSYARLLIYNLPPIKPDGMGVRYRSEIAWESWHTAHHDFSETYLLSRNLSLQLPPSTKIGALRTDDTVSSQSKEVYRQCPLIVSPLAT